MPDNIIGHSLGEIGCAYADDCFTAEQTILTSYFRGVVSIETDCIRGSMAAVGLGYRELKDLCPSDIEVACHNGPGSATISGPADSMEKFMDQLQVNATQPSDYRYNFVLDELDRFYRNFGILSWSLSPSFLGKQICWKLTET